MLCENITGLICARAGSKGVKNKNLQTLCGKTLLETGIEKLRELNLNSIILSTDINISEIAGVTVHKRNEELSSDTAKIVDVIQSLSKEIDTEWILLHQVTSPLISVQTLNRMIEDLNTEDYDAIVTGTLVESNVLKYFIKKDHKLQPINSIKYLTANRQNLPPVYKITGGAFLFRKTNLSTNNDIYSDRIDILTVDEREAMDIDTIDDLELIREMVGNSN